MSYLPRSYCESIVSEGEGPDLPGCVIESLDCKQDSCKVTGDPALSTQKGVEHFTKATGSLVSVECEGGGRNSVLQTISVD